MLKVRSTNYGLASSVILLIAPGMNMNTRMYQLSKEMQQLNIRVASVNYPVIARQQPLDELAKDTNGVAFTVFEEKHNVIESLLSTYFKLTNILYNVVETFYQGNRANIPLEVSHIRNHFENYFFILFGYLMLSTDFSKPCLKKIGISELEVFPFQLQVEIT